MARSCSSVEGAEYLNIGCGKLRFDNCINMDVADNKFTFVDVVGDVRNIPFENERFKGVIFTHVLEHLPKEDHIRSLLEIRRVLKLKGELFIEVPDLMLVCKYFFENFQGRRDYWYQCLYGRSNYESDTHKAGITEQYLTDILFTCGFANLKWIAINKDDALLSLIATKIEEFSWGNQ